jgi:NF-kappa-B inhibitor-interacting Ras-like protein
MGKTLKVIVCGKRATGKTTLLEQLVYNNFSSQAKSNEKYFSTIEDIYIACWEKDKGVKEKIRLYDTKGIYFSG